MRPVYFTLTAAGNSNVHVPDHYISPFNVALGCTVITGTPTYTVQYTFDDTTAAGYNPATGNWVSHPSLTALTAATAEAAIAQPVTGIRLVHVSGTGTIRLAIIQAGGSGR